MAVSATFNIGDLSPYVEDAMENPSDLRSDPSEEGDVDVKHMGQRNKDQGTLASQIQALFSFPSSNIL